MNPLVSVIVPSLRRYGPLLTTVQDLLCQVYPSFEVIVVDQNDYWPEDLRAPLQELRRDPRLVWVPCFPVGVVAARNHAVFLARGDILIFVDDDVRIPDSEFLLKHVECYRSGEVDCVCGRELRLEQADEAERAPRTPPSGRPPAAPPPPQGRLSGLLAFDRSSADPADTPVLSTCNGSVTRRAFLSIGGFDEHFRGASYGDDADFVLRLAAAGGRAVYRPSPWLIHLMTPSGGLRFSDSKATFSDYDRCLSGLLFLVRHAIGPGFWTVLYGWVLRRTFLLKRNLVRPWRQPAVLWALLRALPDAVRSARRGPVSRFSKSS